MKVFNICVLYLELCINLDIIKVYLYEVGAEWYFALLYGTLKYF